MNELNVFCFVTNLVVTALFGVLMPLIPRLTRKSFLFGVRIPPEENGGGEVRLLKKRYAAVCVFGAAVIFAADIAQYIIAPDMTVLAVMYFPLLFVALGFIAYVPCYKAALRLKNERGWQISDAVFAETKSSFTRGKLANLPWAWYIVSLLIILADTAFLLARYPSMPERIATHYDFNMEPNAWADKSIGRIMFMPVANLVTLLFMFAVGVIVERGKLQIDANKPALSFAQHSVYRRRMGHSIGFLALGIAIMFILPDLSREIGFRLNFWAWLLVCFIPTAVVCVVSVGSGQGGCLIKIPEEKYEKYSPESASRNGAVKDGGDDRFWALGIFYHNPDDPSIFVGDRFGGNFGLNYSRRSVKIGAAAFVIIMIMFYVWFTLWWLGR